MEKNNLEYIYRDALSTSKKLITNCRDFTEKSIKESLFYDTISFKKVLIAIIEVILPIAMFFFRDDIMKYIMLFFSEIKIAYPIEYVITLYNATAILILCCGVYRLVKIIMTCKEKESAKKLQDLGNRLEESVKVVFNGFNKELKEAIEKGEDLVFEPMEYWQVEFNEYKNNYNQTQKQYKKILQIVGTIVWMAAIVFVLKFFFPYIVVGLAQGYGYTSGYIVFTSYIILTMVLATAFMNIHSWYSRVNRYMMATIFTLYQMMIVLKLNENYQIFDFFIKTIKSKNTDIILENCVLNYTVIALLLVTLATVWMFLATKFDLIKEARKKGFTVPMEYPDNDRVLSPENVRNMFLLKGIIATIATMFISAWMPSIIAKGLSLGSVIGFIVIAAVWASIYSAVENIEMKAIYNKFSVFLYLICYIGYVIMVLSATPGFALGTIILLGIHFFSLPIILILLDIWENVF